MGGFFGAVSHQDVTLDIFFGVDYHSHLGTRRGGMIIHDAKDGFQRQIHSIENTPFRTKFEKDLSDFHGCSGIGCISDTDPQPLLVRSHLGLYAITTVGIINNAEELIQRYFSDHGHQFMAMSSGKVNSTELAAALINQKDDLVSGILHAQPMPEGRGRRAAAGGETQGGLSGRGGGIQRDGLPAFFWRGLPVPGPAHL